MIERTLRHTFGKWLEPLVAGMASRGVSPSLITAVGLLLAIAGAFLVAFGGLVPGGLLFVLGSALDMIDGSVARAAESSTGRGALLDAVGDRVGETAIWTAIGFVFAGDPIVVALAVVGLGGSLITSYVRAKAETLEAYKPSGLIGRTERVILIGVALVSGFVTAVLAVLVVLVWVTVLQRFLSAWLELSDG